MHFVASSSHAGRHITFVSVLQHCRLNVTIVVLTAVFFSIQVLLGYDTVSLGQ